MPEVPQSPEDRVEEPLPSETAENERDVESEVGEFVTRNVLEKDSVFFEG